MYSPIRKEWSYIFLLYMCMFKYKFDQIINKTKILLVWRSDNDNNVWYILIFFHDLYY